MAKLAIINEADVPSSSTYEGTVTVTGLAWAKKVSPEGYSLSQVVAEFEPGGSIEWGTHHGDEGIYLLSGELEVDGSVCPTGGAVIVESGVPAKATARTRSKLVHCSPISAQVPTSGPHGPPESDGRTVHVTGDLGWVRTEPLEGVAVSWFADSTCPSCRISLFRVEHDMGFAGPSHSHSQDEIIFVLNGEVRLGATDYGPGTAFSIPADIPYRVSYPNGADFLNFRRDASEMKLGRNGIPVLEGASHRN